MINWQASRGSDRADKEKTTRYRHDAEHYCSGRWNPHLPPGRPTERIGLFAVLQRSRLSFQSYVSIVTTPELSKTLPAFTHINAPTFDPRDFG
jgi:hypothetical protein